MKSTPGSDRETPLHGHVVFVSSTTNMFSLVPDPCADTDVAVAPPAALALGEVGERPGVARIGSNMLARRIGIP